MFHKRLLPLLCCLLLLPSHMAWAETSDAAPVTVAYGGQSIGCPGGRLLLHAAP